MRFRHAVGAQGRGEGGASRGELRGELRDTEELELGAFNLAPSHRGHRQAAERNLFASGGVDTFHLTFAEELGEPMHAELRTDHDNPTWSVERVVLGRVQGAARLDGGGGGASAGGARCVTFEAREGGGGGLSPRRSGASSSAVGVGPAGRTLQAQATLHVLLHLAEAADLDVLELSLVLHGRQGSAEAINLAHAKPLPPPPGSEAAQAAATRHYVLRYDDRGAPLLRLGEISRLEIEPTRHAGPPVLLEGVTLWGEHSGQLAWFPCQRWLDRGDEGAASFLPSGASPLCKTLHAAGLHVGAAPPAPSSLTIEIREVTAQDGTGESTQMLSVAWRGDGGKAPVRGMRWKLQVVQEGERQVMEFGRAAPRFEEELEALQIGQRPLEPGKAYFWRVAAEHPDFGCGSFSPIVRLVLAEEEAADGGAPRLVVSTMAEIASHRPSSRASGLAVDANLALHFGSPGAPGGAAAAEGRGTATPFETALTGGGAGGGASGGGPRLCLVGDAGVWRGMLDLTPLRLGMGLSGAAWFHRPVEVSGGFQSDFSFRITPPNEPATWDGASGRWVGPRGSHGFAFVLQLDGRGTAALGASGVELGHGGLSPAVAVQFTTHVAQPSSARRQRAGGRVGDAEEEGEVEGPRGSTLCTLPEPHDHIFYVPNELAGKECVCPFTDVHFFAPALGDAAAEAEACARDEAELTLYEDRVSVRCAGADGADPDASSSDACLASAPLAAPLDDGKPHAARVVLLPNRFERWAGKGATSAAEEGGAAEGAAPSHRLLVYVDDMQHALINLEVSLPALLGADAAEGRMVAGFTAATGKRHASHCIGSWSLYEVATARAEVARGSWLSRARNLVGA